MSSTIENLEKIISKKLKLVNRLHFYENSYYLDSSKQLLGISFFECQINESKLRLIASLLKDISSLKILAIDSNPISDISSLKDLNNLTYLHLANNEISDVSPLKELKNLRDLILDSNRISDITPLEELTNLTQLHLGSNKASDLFSLKDLNRLKTLILSSNHISDIYPLTSLINLVNLNLSNNQVSELSPLKSLKSLGILSIGNNKIKDILPLRELTKLTQLYLANNRISDISPLKDLKALSYLGLEYNQVTDISALKNLTRLGGLYLQENPIAILPPWITNVGVDFKWEKHGFSHHVFFYNNPLKSPPSEIVKEGKNAVKNYFKQLNEQKEDYLFEAKLLILGEPGAGKTSMAWKLENSECELPREEDTTKGIEVKQFYFSVNNQFFPLSSLNATDINFRLNIWDFAGQDIYKATHRFFLNTRSIYFLIADSRNENTDFNYWLHLIEMFGGESPLIIVLNEKHQRKRHINVGLLKSRFTNIKEVVEVDFAEKSNARLEKLKNVIKYYASQLPHIGSPVPAKWATVRHAIDEDGRNTITLQDYLGICKNNGIENTNDSLVLSRYFHDIGVFLHFSEDELLKKTIFLKPNWATNAVYKILDHELLLERNGRFSKSDADLIWRENDFLLVRDELLQIMQRFFLCYRLKNTNEYIVPERLYSEQPDYSWNENNNLFLRYKYDLFMPKGIISQFIVQMNKFISDQHLVWRNGVVLRRENTLAEVIETYESRSIEIRLAGENRRDFMTIIADKLDDINAQFEKLQVEKLIPCVCDECKNSNTPYFYKYKDLKRRLNNGIKEVECENSYKRVEVRKLIDDVFSKSSVENYPINIISPSRTKKLIRIFISYAHNDNKKRLVDLFCDELTRQLEVLKQEYEFNLFKDDKIIMGEDWHSRLQTEINNADVAILLLSSSFFASKYILANELANFLEYNNEKSLVLCPIYFDPFDFSRYQAIKRYQFFKPQGNEFGPSYAHLGDDLCYGDLVNFDPVSGLPQPNINRSRYMRDFVSELENALNSKKYVVEQ